MQITEEQLEVYRKIAHAATQGKWHVDTTEDDLCPEYVYDENGKGVANTTNNKIYDDDGNELAYTGDRKQIRTDEEMYANARFIATFNPELVLELLQYVENILNY